MRNVKCASCGLINWAGEKQCKRCAMCLTDPQNKPLSNSTPAGSVNPPFFSNGMMVLAVILGFALLVLLLHRVFHVIEPGVAGMFALMFMLSGIALLIVTHLWVVLRIFEENSLLGLGSLGIPILGLIGVSMYWEKTRTPFISQLISMMIMFAGYAIVQANK